MKPLIILAMLLTVVQTVPPVPRQTADTRASNNQKAKENGQDDKHPPVQAAIISKPGTADGSTQAHQNNTSQKEEQPVTVSKFPSVSVSRDWVDYFALTFSGALVAIGFFGVRYAMKTLDTIKGQLAEIKAAGKQTDQMIEHVRRQADATRDAADAAKNNAQALMDAERAWLLVEDVQLPPEGLTFLEASIVAGQSPQQTYFTVRFRNFGKTPAVIYGKEIRFSISDSSHEPPRTDIYGAYHLTEYRHIVPQDTCGSNAPGAHLWIEGGFLEPTSWLSHQQFMDVNNRAEFLWAYGVVKYIDVYERRHETRFCYRYDVPPLVSEDHAHFCLAGPREFNQAT